jgi:DNA-binding transcriptional LysR family regulator
MNAKILSRRGFSLDRLAGFCAVADAGSSVGAARGDVVRQSLLSRQIRELEECFETELVRRHGRGLVLTDTGRQLAALGRSQFASLDDFAAACHGTRVTVSFVASETLLQWLILPRLAALRAACPQADFTAFHEDNAAIAARVQEGTYDFGFLRRKPERDDTCIAELGNLDYLLAAPRGLVRGREWTLTEALTKLPLAVPIGGTLRDALAAFLHRHGAALTPALGCTSYLHAAAALRSGACAAVLPTLAMGEFTADRYLTWPLAPLKLTRDPVSVIWSSRNAAVRPVVAALADAAPGILKF